MKSTKAAAVLLALTVLVVLPPAEQFLSLASEPPAGNDPPATRKPSPAEVRKQREARFKDMLTDVVFLGTWQMTNAEGLKGKAPLSPPRPERYTIKGVSRGLEDNWVITARVEFADRDVELPFSVRVVWAGDTPVITLDKTALPMLGEYSARVMVYGGFYAGTWFGTNYGGILSGQIIKAADEKKIREIADEARKIDLPPKPTTMPANQPADG